MSDQEVTIGIKVLDQGATATLDKLDKALSKVDKEVADLGKTSKKSEKAVGGLEDELGDLGKTSKKSEKALDELAKANKKVGKTAKKAEKETFDLGKAIEGAGLASGEHLGNMAFLAGAVGAAFVAGVGALAVGSMQRYLASTEEGRITTDAFTAALDKNSIALGKVLTEASDTTATINALTVVLNDATKEFEKEGSTISDAFEGISAAAKFAFDKIVLNVAVPLGILALIPDSFRLIVAGIEGIGGGVLILTADLGEFFDVLDASTAQSMRIQGEWNSAAFDRTMADLYSEGISDLATDLTTYVDGLGKAAEAQGILNKEMAKSVTLAAEAGEAASAAFGGEAGKPKAAGVRRPKKQKLSPQTDEERGREFEQALAGIAAEERDAALRDELEQEQTAADQKAENAKRIKEGFDEIAASAGDAALRMQPLLDMGDEISQSMQDAADGAGLLDQALLELSAGGITTSVDAFSGMLSMYAEGKSTMRDYVEFGLAEFGAFFEQTGKGWLLTGIASLNPAQAVGGGLLMAFGALMGGGSGRRGGAAGSGGEAAAEDRQVERESFRRQGADPDNKEQVMTFNLIMDGEAIKTQVSRANASNLRRGETSSDARRF